MKAQEELLANCKLQAQSIVVIAFQMGSLQECRAPRHPKEEFLLYAS